MRQIRSRNTRPELTVRSFLHRRGFRFRIHQRDLPGSPDIVLRKHRAVVLVHGCFWHQHPGCRFKGVKIPDSNRTYWGPKLERNARRDLENQEALRARGWRVSVVWECEISEKRLDVLAGWINVDRGLAKPSA